MSIGMAVWFAYGRRSAEISRRLTRETAADYAEKFSSSFKQVGVERGGVAVSHTEHKVVAIGARYSDNLFSTANPNERRKRTEDGGI